MIMRRYMNHLACKYIPNAGNIVHVVDPYLNLNKRFDDKDQLKKNLKSRGIENINIDKIEEEYKSWWKCFIKMKNLTEENEIKKINKELKSKSNGLLNALSLPNDVSDLDNNKKIIEKSTYEAETVLSHIPILKMMGLCRSDSKNGYLHLLGYPVNLKDEIKERLLKKIHYLQPVSPPYMIREAILEGCNVNKNNLLPITEDGKDNGIYLLGVSLPTMLSKFVKTRFISNKNEWPIIIRGEGNSYKKPRMIKYLNLFNSCQKEIIGIVIFGRNDEECKKGSEEIVDLVRKEINDNMKLPIERSIVSNDKLKNYEKNSVVYLNSSIVPNPEIIRISSIGTYISERLNIVYGEDKVDFVCMNYIEIDISNIVGSILEVESKNNNMKINERNSC
uniref:DUF512 domain-containing protein n=1 Tax=Parastrongyloides trichosuri TaxID=131310 RepID=A0A0N5A670_PARTI